jgi:aryl-alcohol dehydrogenase-like predicted oxidoreductase
LVTSPIVGVTKPSHLSDAIAAVDVDLDADEVVYLEEPYVPHTVAGFQ